MNEAILDVDMFVPVVEDGVLGKGNGGELAGDLP
jgi:hypothetical protein